MEGGGVAQRTARLASDCDWEPLPLNSNLRRDWGRGTKSAKQVLQDASDAKHQGARGLDRLGKRVVPSNAQRDL